MFAWPANHRFLALPVGLALDDALVGGRLPPASASVTRLIDGNLSP
jgi:hypothetical protein